MSQAVPTTTCPTCGHVLLYQEVQSPKNKGRWLAQCHFYNVETQMVCKTFRWLSASRTPSPIQPRPAVSLENPPSFLGTPTPAPVASALRAKCPVIGCNSTRINKLCSNHMCKDHCKKSSKGCVAPAHKVVEPPNTAYAAGSQPTLLPRPFPLADPPFFPNVDPVSLAHPPPGDSPIVSQPLPMASSAPANVSPVYASHMSDIYTTQIALEEKMREDGRQMEAMRLASKRKVQHTVFVYAWIENDAPANLFEIQEGFAWPHFTFSEAILAIAGFDRISPETRFNIYRFNLGLWTTVPINHVVELKDGPRVFVKPLHITSCLDFDKILASSSLSNNPPNIRTNLAGERDYVKRRMVALELAQSTSTLPDKGKRKAPSSPFATPPAHKRHYTTAAAATSPEVSDDECEIIPVHRPPRDTAFVPRWVGSSTSSAATRLVCTPKRITYEDQVLATPQPSSSGAQPSLDVEPVTPSFLSKSSSSSSSPPPSSSSMSSTSTPVKRNQVSRDRNRTPVPFLPRTGKLRWPADFFAVDIVGCFEACDVAGEDTFRIHAIFDSRFGQWVPFVRSTFYEHLSRWKSATSEAKNAVLSAGRTPAGLWSVFMATTPAPRARIKAERKRKGWVGLSDREVLTIPSDDD